MLDRFLSKLWLSSSQLRLFETGIPILTYHSIAKHPPDIRDPFLYVSPERFEEQLSALRVAGFTSGSLSEVVRASDNRSRKVVITFDDGYRNVFRNALEILARHGFHAIQFIVADLIGQRNEWEFKNGELEEPLMDTAEIRDWLAAGHEIGSHSLTHRNLSKLSASAAREQIFGSKKKLEDLFGIEIRHFAYPHGKWNKTARDLVAEAGYQTACTTEFGINTRNNERLALKRVFPLSIAETFAKSWDRLLKKRESFRPRRNAPPCTT